MTNAIRRSPPLLLGLWACVAFANVMNKVTIVPRMRNLTGISEGLFDAVFAGRLHSTGREDAAPPHQWRAQIVPAQRRRARQTQRPGEEGTEGACPRHVSITRAQRLACVFAIEVLLRRRNKMFRSADNLERCTLSPHADPLASRGSTGIPRAGSQLIRRTGHSHRLLPRGIRHT